MSKCGVMKVGVFSIIDLRKSSNYLFAERKFYWKYSEMVFLDVYCMNLERQFF